MPGSLPAAHRRSVSTIGCPLNPVRRRGPRASLSGVRGVPPPGVQPVQCPLVWLPAPDAAVRLACVQSVRRPAAWCPPVRPVAAVSSRVSRVLRGGRLGTAGQRSRPDRVEFHAVRPPSPAARSTAQGGTGCRHRRGGRVAVGGGASAAGLGRVMLAREAAPDRPGRPGHREVVARHRVGGHLGQKSRLLSVVVVGPDDRVDGPGRIKRARRRGWRAAPVRPRQVPSATRYAGSVVTCENGGGRDRV
jgi:hypothetical protein